LVIDSHKGANPRDPEKPSLPLFEDEIPEELEFAEQNLHWQNAKIIADALGAQFIWSYPSVNDNIGSDFDAIVFVHASPYAFTDYAWLERSPNARLFYVTNEYNLGEPRTLWMAATAGRRYSVIANHPPAPSKIVKKYVDSWHIINLNALTYRRLKDPLLTRSGCIYYGSFRKDRVVYFKRYLQNQTILSTHSGNIDKFRAAGARCRTLPRLCWQPRGHGLSPFKASLYIEDVTTHTHYNHLANRFYEGLNYGTVSLFAQECRRTVELSGYEVPDDYYVSTADEIERRIDIPIIEEWHERAELEREDALADLVEIISCRNKSALSIEGCA